MRQNRSPKTSWGRVGDWYQKLVGSEGHYFHQHLILPKLTKMLNLNDNSAILDLGCGQGVLGRSLKPNIYYQGVDVSGNLISSAKKQDRNNIHHYLQADLTRPLSLAKKDFTDAVSILALQNMGEVEPVVNFAYQHLKNGGKFYLVLNHPCFRIPRQSGWTLSDDKKTQSRWVNRYLSFMKIPINTHPGKPNSPVTWTFHHPLSEYINTLTKAGFVITKLDEWSSEKHSEGKAAKAENLSRQEIPLFMLIVGRK